jgi:hypothetical protein
MSKPTLARELHLTTLDDILAEAKRIAAQPDATSRGTWTPAQNIWHVGRFIKAGVEGYPAKVPFILKLIGPLLKKRFTTTGFSPGIKLPSQAADHMVAPADTTIEQAMDMFETAVQGAKDKGFLPKNPMMGKMTPQQWIDLHCRHAEMHFGLIELKD